MPVLEHEVNEKVKQGEDARWGCLNGDRSTPGYWGLDRKFYPDGRFDIVPVFIEGTATRECRHDTSLKDPKCEGCCHRGKAEKYWEEYRRKLAEEAKASQ